MLEAIGARIFRHPRRILIAAGVFLALSIGVVLSGGRLTGGQIHGVEADRAERRIERVRGAARDTTLIAVFTSPSSSSSDGGAGGAITLDAIDLALAPLRHDPSVASVITPRTAPLPRRDGMFRADHRAAYAMISLSGDLRQAVAAYPRVRREIAADGLTVTLTGRPALQHDLDDMLAHDLRRAELIALPLSLLVLLLAFRTVVAAILPVAVGGLAVLGGVAVVLAISRYVEIASYTINIVSLVGLGVAIDYSLFTVSRYREELAEGHDYRTALMRTMATAGRVVAFSGLAVGTGLTGLFAFRGSYLASMGLGGAIVVGLAVLFALSVLPALLVALGPHIHRGRISLPRLAPTRNALLRRLSWILGHPWRVVVPTLGLLLVMSVPFCHLRMASIDTNVLPPAAEARRGQELLHAAFPDLARTRFEVAVELPTAPELTRERIGALYDLSRRIAAIPGVAKVESIVDGPIAIPREAYPQLLLSPPAAEAALIEAGKALTVGHRIVLLDALSDLPPYSTGARDIVKAIRSTRAVGDGQLVVGGQTAADVDSTAFVASRAPHAIVFVVCVTLVVLFLTFGSVVLPIKAVLLNLASIGASFGGMVWVFQEGHLGVQAPRPIDPSVPILLFCILFGLSMDYHVLMVSRIREAYLRGHDNTRAISTGLTRSAGLITSAAAIMVTVFAAFTVARFVVIRSVGFGMALAVTLDATIVRLLLVPATMTLLGDWNWWTPHRKQKRPPGLPSGRM